MTAETGAIRPVMPALRAYGGQAAGAAASAAAPGGDFAGMVGDAVRGSLQTLRRTEATGARAMTGGVDVQAVVQAATAAELTVQAVTQLRDKAVSAYMDVLRMAV